jgi:hypothetical protein
MLICEFVAMTNAKNTLFIEEKDGILLVILAVIFIRPP